MILTLSQLVTHLYEQEICLEPIPKDGCTASISCPDCLKIRLKEIIKYGKIDVSYSNSFEIKE